MCLVPAFFHYLDSNTGKRQRETERERVNVTCMLLLPLGVLEMVSVATNDSNVGNVINHLAWKIQNTGVRTERERYSKIMSFFLYFPPSLP